MKSFHVYAITCSINEVKSGAELAQHTGAARLTYLFGEFRVNPTLRELWRGDELIELPPHTFDFLVYLLERSERAVGRDELVAAIWGKVEVSDTLLGKAVLRIRHELGDDAKEQRFLRTIPRFGYRWVAPIQIAGEDEVPAPPPDTARFVQTERVGAATAPPVASAAARSLRGRKRIAAAVAIIFATLLVSAWALQGYMAPLHPLRPSDASESLLSAVLPAAGESGAEWSWTRLAIMEVVAGRLRSSGLPSVPSENVIAFLKASEAHRGGTIREATSASLLIAPAVRRIDAFWEVSLNADDAAGRHHSASDRASDPLSAARGAADKLLAALGRRPVDPDKRTAHSDLIQRVDAAILADDPAMANALISKAPVEEKQSPELRLRLAKIDFRAGRFAAVRERLVALLQETPKDAFPVLRASILNGLGNVAIREDKSPEAIERFDEAINLLTPNADAAQLGIAYMGRGGAAAQQHRFGEAVVDYARARIAFRDANDRLALIRVAANEGFLDMDSNRPTQALPQLQTATEGFSQWGALNEAIYTSVGQIGCSLELLDGAAAMRVVEAAAVLAEKVENPDTLASLALARANALIAVGRLHEARSSLERMRSSSDDSVSSAMADAMIAQLDLPDRPDAAADRAEKAVAALTEPSYAKWRARAWLALVRARLRTSDRLRADNAATAFEVWAAQAAQQRSTIYARLARAEFALKFDADGAWRREYDAARRRAEQGAIPLEVAAVAESYADALIKAGDLPAATVEVGRVSRWSDQDFASAVLETRLYGALRRENAQRASLAKAIALAGERTIPDEARRAKQ